jgi:hypothetical protein
MVLCFTCTPETKALLDRLVATGHYEDHSQVLAAAIQNLAVIHSELQERTSLIIERNYGLGASVEGDTAVARQQPATPVVSKSSSESSSAASPGQGAPAIPAIFHRHPDITPPAHFADVTIKPAGKAAAIDAWMWGQYNRLLPAKVTCRALINMFGDGSERQPLEKQTTAIANEAAKLGRYLSSIDEKRHLGRDDAMAIAFPKNSAEFKSIQRFATQFVASANKEGELSGLAVSLNLIGRNPDYPEGIALTKAGWDFGMIENPLLDRIASGIEKFSADEISFLLDHIAATVPVEAFAYQTILREVSRNILTPDALDAALSELPGHPKKALPQFVSTQRSGAICRMADLDLIARNRSGTRVSYVLTVRGKDFLRSAKLDALDATKQSRA